MLSAETLKIITTETNKIFDIALINNIDSLIESRAYEGFYTCNIDYVPRYSNHELLNLLRSHYGRLGYTITEYSTFLEISWKC